MLLNWIKTSCCLTDTLHASCSPDTTEDSEQSSEKSPHALCAAHMRHLRLAVNEHLMQAALHGMCCSMRSHKSVFADTAAWCGSGLR